MTLYINRSELMKLAWAYARQDHWSRRMPAGTLRSLFPDALRAAWQEMRSRAELAAERAAEVAGLNVAALRAELLSLENTDYLGHEGMRRMSVVQSALRAAEAHRSATKPVQVVKTAKPATRPQKPTIRTNRPIHEHRVA